MNIHEDRYQAQAKGKVLQFFCCDQNLTCYYGPLFCLPSVLSIIPRTRVNLVVQFRALHSNGKAQIWSW